MTKIAGIQTFKTKHDNLKHVFKSDKLQVVDESGIRYNKGFNNNPGNQVLTVSKYMKISNLVKSIEENNFFFTSPLNWFDPFELFFFRPQMNIANEGLVCVHACCFACNDIENEEGFWQIWSIGENEPIVRVTYNIEKLLESLNRNAKDQYDFYLAGMEYVSRDKIMNLYQEKQVDSYEKIDDYLNMLCHKRNAYKYENELRLFVKRKATDNQPENTIIREIGYCDGIITEITLPPAKPFGNSNPDKEMIKEYQECVNSLIRKKLQRLIEKRKLICNINQSALYCTNVDTRTY